MITWAMRSLGFLLFIAISHAQVQASSLGQRARQQLIDLIRIDTTNPPGNETPAAEYLKRAVASQGIQCELLGDDPARLNFVARLRGSGSASPLLLMAHSDVVPADRTQWTADPYAGEIRDGYIYGRGADDDKCLLSAELAVFLELKRQGLRLNRDVILLAEADEEAGSTGIQWLIRNAWAKIEAGAAINEGGSAFDTRSGVRLFQVQTTEKIPTRVVLTARGTAGHGSLPRPDNAVVRLARAIVRLTEADQPVRFNATTRRYFAEIARLPDHAWLAPILPRFETPALAGAAANEIRARSLELDAQLRTSISPTMLQAGSKINVLPNVAEAQVDVRRLPNETREEVMARFRQIIRDSAVEISPAPGQEMPPTEPSSITTELYRTIARVLNASVPRALVVPFMSRGATDGAFLREKGVAVYGVPLFTRPSDENRAHGNDERISLAALEAGTNLLWKIVTSIAVGDEVRAQ